MSRQRRPRNSDIRSPVIAAVRMMTLKTGPRTSDEGGETARCVLASRLWFADDDLVGDLAYHRFKLADGQEVDVLVGAGSLPAGLLGVAHRIVSDQLESDRMLEDLVQEPKHVANSLRGQVLLEQGGRERFDVVGYRWWSPVVTRAGATHARVGSTRNSQAKTSKTAHPHPLPQRTAGR